MNDLMERIIEEYRLSPGMGDRNNTLWSRQGADESVFVFSYPTKNYIMVVTDRHSDDVLTDAFSIDADLRAANGS